jgi:hypothetical protein
MTTLPDPRCGVRFCSGGLQAAMGGCGDTNGALKCAATTAALSFGGLRLVGGGENFGDE